MNVMLSPWRVTAWAALVIAATNIVVLSIGRLLGADMAVAPSGDAPTHVGVGSVVLMSVGSAALGGFMLWLAARRGVRAWRAVGWLGLAFGIVTVSMPVGAVATASTTATLSGMHVAAGLIWFTAVRRSAARQQEPVPPRRRAATR